MKARLFQAWLGGDGFMEGRWLAVVDWGSSLSAAKVAFLHGAMAGIVSSRMFGFAAALDAVSVFFPQIDIV